MTRKYRVHFETNAYATVDVEVPDNVTDPEEIVEHAYEVGTPTLCAQCNGWGSSSPSFGLDLGDFEPVTHTEGPLKGLAYVTDEDGKPLDGDGSPVTDEDSP